MRKRDNEVLMFPSYRELGEKSKHLVQDQNSSGFNLNHTVQTLKCGDLEAKIKFLRRKKICILKFSIRALTLE